MNTETPTAADLRASLARAAVPAYVVAARIRIHPVTFSLILRGRRLLTPELAQRILEAIDAEEKAAR